MRLSKNQMYLFITGIIVLVMLINKSTHLLRCNFAEGVIINRTRKHISGTHGRTATFNIVQFSVNNKIVLFNSSENSRLDAGQRVTVVYLRSDINKAQIFNLSEYWIPGFTRGLFAFIILSGIVYAFLHPNHVVEITFKKPFRISIRHKRWNNSNNACQSEPDLSPKAQQKQEISEKTCN